MMERKSVNLPIEDPVTNAVNAAKPLISNMSSKEKNSIELLILGTESGLDFGKSISTYVAHYLGLPQRCRSFEVKHACYGGTAALQMATALVATYPRPDVKALVIAADASSIAARDTYWEPSQGAGAVAMLVGNYADVLTLDIGANGYCSYEVMDTLRPRPDLETGDSDLSLLSYMSCLQESFDHYRELVEGAEDRDLFRYLVLHTPFAGMVKSAHRRFMHRVYRLSSPEINVDFEKRVEPSIRFCMQVGNIYSASLYLALCSLLEHGHFHVPERVGLYSYGSGCASEFYSGVVSPSGVKKTRAFGIGKAISDRWELNMLDYDRINDLSTQRMAGVRNLQPDCSSYSHILESRFENQGLLVLEEIKDFHRVYRWT